ncbi:MAG: universal stress protein [Bacillota bacterium]|nr:universal stress protein [Bacillota bacterium]
MYHILLAVDGSEHTKKVVEEALLIAEAMKAKISVITVVGENIFSPRVSVHFSDENWEMIHRYLREEAEEIVNNAAKPFMEKGLDVSTDVIMGHQSPADAICERASELKANMIVVGSRGLRGIKEMFLGSVSNRVAHLGSTNIMIAK